MITFTLRSQLDLGYFLKLRVTVAVSFAIYSMVRARFGDGGGYGYPGGRLGALNEGILDCETYHLNGVWFGGLIGLRIGGKSGRIEA